MHVNRTGNAQATSEHSIYLAMNLLRNKNQVLTRRFQNRILGGMPIPQTIYKKNVTVIGFGNVCSVLAQYFLFFGANVTAARRQGWCDGTSIQPQQYSNQIIQAKPLQEVLQTTQILFLACSMTPESLQLMNENSISMLPRGTIIVNVGRGPLVEYNAILKAPNEGHIAGFASDVGVGHSHKPSEPWDPKDELSMHPNTIFTPYVGGDTDYAYNEMASQIMTAVQEIIQGRPPPGWVNRDIVI